MKKQLISSEEGNKVSKQHHKPCSDCPFSRDSLSGWLGGGSAKEFITIAHSDESYGCHVKIGAQCAGMGIYRANVGKCPRNVETLKLPQDKSRVFSTPMEFLEHHKNA